MDAVSVDQPSSEPPEMLKMPYSVPASKLAKATVDVFAKETDVPVSTAIRFAPSEKSRADKSSVAFPPILTETVLKRWIS